MAQKKPQGFWDDIVYPIASKAMKKAVKSGKMKNTTRVKTNRAILDRAYVKNQAKTYKWNEGGVRGAMKVERDSVKNANRIQKYERNKAIAGAKVKARTSPFRGGPYDMTASYLNTGKRTGIAMGSRRAKMDTTIAMPKSRSEYGAKISGRKSKINKKSAAGYGTAAAGGVFMGVGTSGRPGGRKVKTKRSSGTSTRKK